MSTPAPFMPGQADAPADPGNLRLNLSSGGLCWRLPFCRTELHRALSAMLRAAGSGPAELDLILVRDAGMAGYNLRYMGCHGPTNVLSFPIDEQIAGPGGEGAPVQLGSLVFSVDTLHRETLLYGQEPKEHCLRLLAHGLGHLAGYDHGPEMDGLCSEMLSAALAWLNAQ
ncbi:MAG: rRNA maturation RNase YbeY [Bilophila sp.]|nr:rRNA maturation RNase YbeY [Bilophila sp.]